MQSRMTKAPGTVDFMPPEALADSENIRYDRTLDVFSFGCVMLHTLSHQWPTPSEPVVTDPETGLVTRGRSEVERRSRYFSKLDQSQFGTLIPLIEGCLSNLPKNRISIMRICQELEGLVDSERINNFTVLALQEEIQRKDVEVQNKNAQIQHQATELHSKDVEIATLRSELSSIQMTALQSQSRKINKSSTDFWNRLKLSWRQCADLPAKQRVTSITELDGSVYVSLSGYTFPLKYDSRKDKWSPLPALSVKHFSLVSVPDQKQLLAIGGITDSKDVKVCNKVFQWDEVSSKWLTPYPNMPTARFYCSCVCQRSTVIVAGGVTCLDSLTLTRAVEVLHIRGNSWYLKSHWSVVEQLPIALYQSVPLIIDVLPKASINFRIHPTCSRYLYES